MRGGMRPSGTGGGWQGLGVAQARLLPLPKCGAGVGKEREMGRWVCWGRAVPSAGSPGSPAGRAAAAAEPEEEGKDAEGTNSFLYPLTRGCLCLPAGSG